MTRVVGGLAVLVLCLASVACSGASDPARSTTPAAGGTDAAVAFTPGPLEEVLGWADVGSAQELVVEQTWRENQTAACMAELGFEYWPVVPATGDVVAGTGPERGSAEYVEAYGYGVWTTPEDDFRFSYEADGSANTDYRAGMSEAEGAAYDEALFGPVLDEDTDGTPTRSGGCVEAADHPQGGTAAALSAVRDEAYAYLDAIAVDPRLDEVNADWAACVADAGFTFVSPQAAEESVVAEYSAAARDGTAPGPDVVARGAEAERRLAAADYGCRASTGWTTRHRAIEVELQQEYVDAHRADLDALAAAMAR